MDTGALSRHDLEFQTRGVTMHWQWPKSLIVPLALITALISGFASASLAKRRSGQYLPSPSPAADSLLARNQRVSINSYKTHDGRHHAWLGTVEPRGTDSLLFVRPPERDHGLAAADRGACLVLAKTEVSSITRANPLSSAIVLITLGGAVGVFLVFGFLVGFNNPK